MIKKTVLLGLLGTCLFSCGSEPKKTTAPLPAPVVSEGGGLLAFPDEKTALFFKTEPLLPCAVHAPLTAIGTAGAVVQKSSAGAGQNLVLFEDQDLAGHYSQLVQHQRNIRQIQGINLKQKKLELERTEDLQKHGSATAQELLQAQLELSMEETALANEQTSLMEHEVQLKSGGFDPKALRGAPNGSVYVICDIPEYQLAKIKEGEECAVAFTAYPQETFTGTIEVVADRVNPHTRMVKLRVRIPQAAGKIKTGMFAQVTFEAGAEDQISVPPASVVTVQGKDYVFVKTGPQQFTRRPVELGTQLGERIMVYAGLKEGDEIAVEGVMQLKGLSFGY